MTDEQEKMLDDLTAYDWPCFCDAMNDVWIMCAFGLEPGDAERLDRLWHAAFG